MSRILSTYIRYLIEFITAQNLNLCKPNHHITAVKVHDTMSLNYYYNTSVIRSFGCLEL